MTLRTFNKIVICVLWAFPINQAFSQEKSADENKKTARPRVSLIAIGDPPSPQYDIVNSKRVLKDIPPSEYPPGLLFLKSKKGFQEVHLGLNTPARPLRHPGGSKLTLFESKAEDMESFINVSIPDRPEDLSIFLTRNHITKSWRTQPKAYVFKNGLLSFPRNYVRVINFSRLPVKVLIRKKAFVMKPLGMKKISIPEAEQGILSYKIGFVIKEKTTLIADTAITYSKGARLNFVIYEADGKDKRQPVKYMSYFELPYQAPTKASKASN